MVESSSITNPPAPLVSVCVVAYNHAPFIAQALDSILSQTTNFAFEIIVGEDESSDGTRKIVQQYAQRYPTIIRPLYHSYPAGNRPNSGQPNLTAVLNAAQGKYIAILEGDDYWCHPGKLQSQVKQLEENPAAAMACHAIDVEDIDHKIHSYDCVRIKKSAFDLKDCLQDQISIATGSMFFRKDLVGKLPDWFSRTRVGDYPLTIIASLHGTILFDPQVRAIHRIHAGGIWAQGLSLKEFKTSTSLKMINRIRDITQVYQLLIPLVDGPHQEILRAKLVSAYRDAIWIARQNGAPSICFEYSSKLRHVSQQAFTNNFTFIAKNLVMSMFHKISPAKNR